MRFEKTQIMQNFILQIKILKKSNHAVRQIIKIVYNDLASP
jgi:hypothetical protein